MTDPTRTVVDLARHLPFRAGIVTADSALTRRITSHERLSRTLADCATWPGIGRAKAVVAFADGGAETALESIGRIAFAEQGLPPPVTQAVIERVEFTPRPRVDFLWPEFSTIGEADGQIKYVDREILWQEKLRQEALEEAGYEVVRFTWEQVWSRPREVAARFRAAFARGTRRRLA